VCDALGRMSGPEHEGSDLVTGPTHLASGEPSMSRQPTPRWSKEKIIHRFWSRVDRLNLSGCWNWARSVDGHGYGQFQWNGSHARAHRVAFEICFGPIPNGVYILHRCDNPRCCNPFHLFPGTMKDNTQDMLAKGRDGHGQMPGEHNPNVRLTEEDIREIRLLRQSGIRLKVIAARFGITEANVSYIAKRKGWKHVK
jgi:hypothetical protein